MKINVPLVIAIMIGVGLGGIVGWFKIQQIIACNNGQTAACILLYKH